MCVGAATPLIKQYCTKIAVVERAQLENNDGNGQNRYVRASEKVFMREF